MFRFFTKLGFLLLLAHMLASAYILPGLAQTQPAPTLSNDELHSPKTLQQTTPMRVQILSATSFMDIATNVTYRLYGIDACELTQTAILTRQVWPCGVVATAWMVSATLNKWVACTPIRQDDKVQVARCATGEYPDMAAEMLKAGLAVSLPNPQDQYIKSYAEIETAAKTAYRGVWGSQFQMPWAYRASQTAIPPLRIFPQ